MPTPRFQHYLRELEQIEAPGYGFPVPSKIAVDQSGLAIAVAARSRTDLHTPPDREVYVLDQRRTDGLLRVGPPTCKFAASPAWSQDGSRIAIVAQTGTDPQPAVYVAAAPHFNEWRRLDAAPGMIEGLEFNEDGSAILFIQCAPDAESLDIGYGITDGSKAADSDWAPYVASERLNVRRAVSVDIDTGVATLVSPSTLNVWEAVWEASGSVAFVASVEAGENGWYDAKLYRIAPGANEPSLIYTPAGLQIGSLCAANGNLAFVEALCSDRGLLAGRVVVALAGGHISKVCEPGASITRVNWAGPEEISALGMRGVEVFLARLPVGGEALETQWTTNETVSGFLPNEAVGLADASYIALFESYERFPQLVRIRDSVVEPLWDFSHAGSRHLQAVSGRVEVIEWNGRDGLRLEGFLVTPPRDRPHPVVVQVHGGPVAAWHNTWGLTLGERYPLTNFLVAEGYAVFLPNPRGSAGRGLEFASLVRGDINGEDAEDILAGLDKLLELGLVDGDRVAVTGNSYGGLMSAWFVTQSSRFSAAIPRSPVVNFQSQHFTSNIAKFDENFLVGEPLDANGHYRTRSPITHVRQVRTPTLLIAGSQDRETPASQAQEFYNALREQGCITELVVYPREGHGVLGFPETVDQLARIVDWLQAYLPADRGCPSSIDSFR